MYQPSQFEEKRTEALHQLIAANPLGTLVTLDDDGLNANHVPFEIDGSKGPLGTLYAHVARSNPVWQQLEGGVEPMIVFQGAQAYISPGWYASKAETGKVVPTYNYMVVHAYGSIRAIDDPDELRGLLARLTARHEAAMPQPWRIEDAPRDYIDKLLSAIVGIEIPVTRLLGKWKVSQNRSVADRAGVARGLVEQGSEDAIAMAEMVRNR